MIFTKLRNNHNLIFTKLRNNQFYWKNDPLTLLEKIRDGKITLERAKELQEDLNNTIERIRKRNKTQEQRKTLANLNTVFNGRNEAIEFYNDYSSMILEAKKKAAEEQIGTWLKILTPKQMLQRLPIALGQVKAGK